jgi:hypothetical protein
MAFGYPLGIHDDRFGAMFVMNGGYRYPPDLKDVPPEIAACGDLGAEATSATTRPFLITATCSPISLPDVTGSSAA